MPRSLTTVPNHKAKAYSRCSKTGGGTITLSIQREQVGGAAWVAFALRIDNRKFGDTWLGLAFSRASRGYMEATIDVAADV